MRLSDLRRIIRERWLWPQLARRFPELRRKEIRELAYQVLWASHFSDPEIRRACGEYWTRFRCMDAIKTLVPLAGSSVLDVGCGISSVLHWLPEAGERVGVDPLAAYYQLHYDYPDGIEVVTGPSESLPFPDDRFDVVFCSNAIDHVDEPREAIEEIRRVLGPGSYSPSRRSAMTEGHGIRPIRGA